MASRIAGILLIAAGATAFVVFLVSSLAGILAGLHRVATPGEADLQLKPGSHTVYWETPTPHAKPKKAPDGLSVALRRSDVPLPLESSGPARTRYSTGSRAGIAIHSFNAPVEGTYTVTVLAREGTTLPQGVVVVGRSVGLFGTLWIVLGGLAILGSSIGGGVALLLRSRRKPALPGAADPRT